MNFTKIMYNYNRGRYEENYTIYFSLFSIM